MTLTRNVIQLASVGAVCLGMALPAQAAGGTSPSPKESSKLSIQLTETPKIPVGTNITGRIKGVVKGLSSVKNYRVVIYAKAGDTWYVQPFLDRKLTEIRIDGTFSTDTHGADLFGALLVNRLFDPKAKMTSFPPEGVLAHTTEEPGKKPAN